MEIWPEPDLFLDALTPAREARTQKRHGREIDTRLPVTGEKPMGRGKDAEMDKEEMLERIAKERGRICYRCGETVDLKEPFLEGLCSACQNAMAKD